MSNSELNKLISAIRNKTQFSLNLSSNLIGNSNDETIFPHKLLFTNTQVSKIHKAFKNIKFLKTQLSQFIRSEGFIPDPHPFF